MTTPDLGVPWPIAERYVVVAEEELGVLARDVHRIRAEGAVRGYWRPGVAPGLADELAALAVADDATIVRWVSGHGFLGLDRDPSIGETIEDIREAATGLAAARRLRRGLADEEPPDVLRRLAVEAAGHLVDAKMLAASSGFASREPVRKGAGADIQALHALGVALTWPLQRWTWLMPNVKSTQRNMRLVIGLAGSGPIGVAYIETLREATELPIDHRAGVMRLDWRSQLRRCLRCGIEFYPSRELQLYHDKRCRWAAQKATSRRNGQ
jgi:hypothetical protein